MALPEMRVRVSADTRDAEAGLDRVGAAARENASAVGRMANTTRAAGQVMGRVANDNRGFGRSIQNVSYQVNDFAMQVGAGTAASIALGQQLPQLLQGFGVLGAVLGAVVAIGVPLARVMGDLADQGKDMTSIFGELQPFARAAGDAMVFVKDVGIVAIEAVINNLDQLVITAGLAAAYFAGPVVASFVAARIAALTLADALGFLRTAFIRTAIGAVIGAAGYLIERFLALSRAAGGFGAAFSIVMTAVREMWAAAIVYMTEQFARFLLTVAEAAVELNRQLRSQALQEMTDRMLRAAAQLQEVFRELGGSAQFERAEAAIARIMELLRRADGTPFRLGWGGEGEAGESESAANRERLQTQLDAIRESQMTEQELLMTHLAQKKAILDEALAAELLARQEHADLTRSLEKETADKIIDIEAAKRATMLGQTASLFGALANLAQAGGKKTATIAKAFGIAEAIINTYVGATNALRMVPFPANFAAAAAVIANGLASVATIASVNTNSGGGSASGAAGSATAPPPVQQRPLDVFIQGVGPGDLISGGQLSSLFDKLVEEAGDRGIRPVFAT